MKEENPIMKAIKKEVTGEQHPLEERGYLIYCPTEEELDNDLEEDIGDDHRDEPEDGFIEDDGLIEDVKANIQIAPSNQDVSSTIESTNQSTTSTQESPAEKALEDDERHLVRLEVNIVVKDESFLSEAELETQLDSSQSERFLMEYRSGQVPRHVVGFEGQGVPESEELDPRSSHHKPGGMYTPVVLDHGEKSERTTNGQSEHSFLNPTKTNLSKTPKSKTEGKSYQCSFCDRTFSQSCNLTIHKRRHTGDKPYQCSFCKKRFYSKSYLSVHERTHTGERPYKCSFCSKGFAQWSNLSQHLTTHTGEKLYQCSICHKSFSQSGILNRHMRTHSGERPYRCSVCDKQFSLEYNLSRHMPIHTGEKPYKCTLCNKEYTHMSSLSVHTKTHRNVKATTKNGSGV